MLARILGAILLILASGAGYGQENTSRLPLEAGAFEQQVHRAYTTEQGLPDNDVRQVYATLQGVIAALTAQGTAVFDGTQWQASDVAKGDKFREATLSEADLMRLRTLVGSDVTIRAVAVHNDEQAVAADAGLFLRDDTDWCMALPRQGHVR